jgi:hypothetical protein
MDANTLPAQSIRLSQFCHRAGLSPTAGRYLVVGGKVRGFQDHRGQWWVDDASAAEFIANRSQQSAA